MPSYTPPLEIGKYSTSVAYLPDLGSLCSVDAKTYRLVKATSAISSPAGKVLVTAVTAGVPTWSVATTTTANDPTVAGVVPPAYLATIPADAYFMLQVSGACLGLSAAAFLTGIPVGTSTTAGKIDATSDTLTTAALDTVAVPGGVGTVGTSLAAASAGDEQVGIMLKGLV